MSTIHTALSFLSRVFSQPNLRLCRMRAAIFRILNAVLIASVLSSINGVALASSSPPIYSGEKQNNHQENNEIETLAFDVFSGSQKNSKLFSTEKVAASSQTTTEECLLNHEVEVGPIDTIGPIFLSSDDPAQVWNVSGWFREHGANEASEVRVYVMWAACQYPSGEWRSCDRDRLYIYGVDPEGEWIDTWGLRDYTNSIGIHNLNKFTAPKEFTHIVYGTHNAIGIVRIHTMVMFSLYNVCGAEVEPRMVDDYSVFSSCDTKFGSADPRECPITGGSSYQGTAGDPINTRTGGFDYSVGDFSLSTPAGPLVFQRSYNSLATDLYVSSLGAGWTHNHDVQLIFSDDPGGEEGVVWFKGHTANMYRFEDHGAGLYIPYPGVLASLTRDEGPPLTYSIKTSTQTEYIFDENGKLLEWSNAEGRSFIYSYNASERLAQVSYETGARYLTFSYDSEERITTVEDHTGRQVSYAYDASGDLVSYTDTLG